jgi:hypothetical protein
LENLFTKPLAAFAQNMQHDQFLISAKSVSSEIKDHTKRSFEAYASSFQKLLSAKSASDVAQIHVEHVSSQIDAFVGLASHFCSLWMPKAGMSQSTAETATEI